MNVNWFAEGGEKRTATTPESDSESTARELSEPKVKATLFICKAWPYLVSEVWDFAEMKTG